MDESDLLKVHEGFAGAKHFEISITYGVSIECIENALLWAVELDTSDAKRKNFTCWNWNRKELLHWVRIWVEKHGSSAMTSDAYPDARKAWGETARRFAEELFPELVYDRQECDRQVKALIKGIVKDEPIKKGE